MTSIDYYDNAPRFMWYEKPTLMNQKLFHLPVLGWVTVFQFTLLVGAGLPGMFIALQAGGEYAAPWPLVAAFLFAKFRPPLLGYEMRLYHILRFRAFGPKEKATGPKPKKYSMPRMSGKAKAAEAKPEPDAPLEIEVHDRPLELLLSLPPGSADGGRVEVRLDGVMMSTPQPGSDNAVHVILYPDDMKGERTVTVHDGSGEQVAGRTLVFVQAG